ncbi:helix-turn-helix domain-containing protein [Variovorax sp. KBW07]|uniref:helix-turn-helix domain-containing protein n=1 Tax=Variovorax sp. KBW07 TaxID=2153358 RepID=UPI0021AABA7A|nr:helix-turn-helix transcriptional regulator [Variovorax sp. KBW07]
MHRTFAKPPSKEKAQVAFGAAMRALREARQFTQEGLAERAELHTTYISSVERGERNVSLNNITRIAYALEVLPSELMRCVDPVR